MNLKGKVLIVASDFPPQAEGNVIRIVKFTKNLPNYGWQPIILTISEKSIAKLDHSLKKEFPEGLKIFRAFYPNPFVILDKRWIRKENINVQPIPQGNDTEKKLQKPKRSLIAACKNIISKTIQFARRKCFIPEELVIWLPFAVLKGIYLCYTEKIDVIFSTAPCFTNHLVAMLIRWSTGKKWVADYRDLWTGNPYSKPYGKFRKFLEMNMDKIVIKSCDAVTITTERWREFMLKTWDLLPPNKIITITNGYDMEDFESCQNYSKKNGKISLVHMGTIFRDYPTPLFLDAVGEICHEYPEIKDILNINFTGNIYQEQLIAIHDKIRMWQLDGIVSVNDQVPRHSAIVTIRNSDLLLLIYITGRLNTDGCIPSKLFDYIACNRPIFAIIPSEGVAAEIIRKAKCGSIINPNDKNEMKNELLAYCKNYPSKQVQYEPNKTYLQQFDRRYLTQKLTEVFQFIKQN